MDQEPRQQDQAPGEEYSNAELASEGEKLTKSLSSALDGFGETRQLEIRSQEGPFYSAIVSDFGNEIRVWQLKDNGKINVKVGSIVNMDRMRIRYSEFEFDGKNITSYGNRVEIGGDDIESVSVSERRSNEDFDQPKEKLSIVGSRIESMIESLRQQAPQK